MISFPVTKLPLAVNTDLYEEFPVDVAAVQT